MPIRAIGYVRVSTAEQAREGVSLEAQRARIEANCAAHGHELAAVYADEGISGRRTVNRPGLEEALQHTCRIKGSLVVYSLSRLARSTPDAISIAGRLQKCGAQLVMLAEQVDTNSAAGRMFYTVLAALAAFESDQIGERTKLAIAHKKSLGQRYCKDAPYGFKFTGGGQLVPNPREQAVLHRMRELRSTGLSLREIAVALHGGGVKNRRAGPFAHAQIHRLLRRFDESAQPPIRVRPGMLRGCPIHRCD